MSSFCLNSLSSFELLIENVCGIVNESVTFVSLHIDDAVSENMKLSLISLLISVSLFVLLIALNESTTFEFGKVENEVSMIDNDSLLLFVVIVDGVVICRNSKLSLIVSSLHVSCVGVSCVSVIVDGTEVS